MGADLLRPSSVARLSPAALDVMKDAPAGVVLLIRGFWEGWIYIPELRESLAEIQAWQAIERAQGGAA